MRKVMAIVSLAFAGCPLHALAAEPWQFHLSPYAWFAGLNGNVGTIPPLPAAPIDVSPSDALSDLKGGGMLTFEAKKGRNGLMVDLVYTDVESDLELVPPPISLNMRAISKTTIATLAYEYEVYRQEQTVVDLLAGIRYWETDSELQFSGGLGFLAGRSINNTESWVDPGIGVKGHVPLGNSRFYFEGGVAVGGFNVGSNHFYDINANIGYQWNKSIGTGIGYRLFDVNYEHDGYVYDITQQGWLLGLTWSF